MGNSRPVRVHGQPSWRFQSDRVAAAITELGGHLAPVRFRLPHGTVEPFSIAPWAAKEVPAADPDLLRVCRGDFFCAPFGASEKAYRGEKHAPHGEVANAKWKFVSLAKTKLETVLHLSLRTKVRKGCVDKFVRLRCGETALYCRHVLSGMSGRMSYGHHAILKFPDAPGSGLISMSPISHAQVLPERFEDPAKGGYQSLKIGATFTRLDRVPALDGSLADLSSYPARRGFEDLVMIAHEAAPDFAWTAVTFPKERYVWFALKDPRVLRSTVFWISNGGRHYAPWSGRHISRMGLEDVTSYFHLGLAASAEPNAFSKRGIATCAELKPFPPLVVNYIMGVAEIPAKWGPVKSIVRTPHGVTLQSARGRDVLAPLDVSFLYAPADDFVAC